MNDKTKEHLMTAYEGYKQSLKGVTEWITQNQEQLAQAMEHQSKMQESIKDLEDLLDIKAEETSKEEVTEAQLA